MSSPLTTDRPAAPASTPEALEKPRESARPARRRERLTPTQQDLAARYVPMARALAKPLKTAWPVEGEEFESAAMLALVEAAQSYEPERNVKFATFARYRIWGALRDVQRRLVTAGWRGDAEHAPSITSLTYDAEENGRVLGAEPDAPVGSDIESDDFLEAWLRKLPSKHAAACRCIYLEGKNQVETAEALGCSKSRLSYLHKESMEILNDAWAHQARKENNPRKYRSDRIRD
ncbi:MAG: sigma-70 family RNA polymerase sigma factor [Isosphaeraceae bacterium]